MAADVLVTLKAALVLMAGAYLATLTLKLNNRNMLTPPCCCWLAQALLLADWQCQQP